MMWVLSFLISYLLGSFSGAYFLGRFVFRRDIGQEGTGNLGAKNSFLVGGPVMGVLVFGVDVAKGVLAVLLAKWLFGEGMVLYWAAVAVILGHNFSIYIGFRGGKGLATLVGVLSVLNVYVLLVIAALAGVFAWLSRDAAVATIIAAVPFPFMFSLIAGDWRALPFMLVLTVLVLVKHKLGEFADTAEFLHLVR